MGLLELVGKARGYGDKVWFMPLSAETFVHFTSEAAAKLILSDKRLLLDPPLRAGPGGYSVNAVSLTYGSFVPGTQLQGRKLADLVAVKFSTKLTPHVGYIEEVKWQEDVPLTKPSLIKATVAAKLLRRSPETIGDIDMVFYDEDDALRQVGVSEVISRLVRLLNGY